MRLGWKHLAGLAVLAIAGGLLVAWSGLVSVAASSGHWPPVAWFLHYTMRQAVDTQSSGIEVPDTLDDLGQAALGAGHFAGGCAPCHGAPGELQSAVALAMTPQPPWLSPKISEWAPEELFWIVQHGIKYSGMPAWVTQVRPEEVWSVVAFLQRLPDMDEATYRRLALGPEAERPANTARSSLTELGAGPIEPLLANCARCHGRDGAGIETPLVPFLGGQNEPYLAATLRAYAATHRASGIMQPLARGLDDEEVTALARHYATQPHPAGSDGSSSDPEQLARGEAIARSGLPAQGVPPCSSCHGPPTRYPHYPEIAGQKAGYIARQLELFRDGTRGGTPFAHLMLGFAPRLTDADIQAVATFYASAPAGSFAAGGG